LANPLVYVKLNTTGLSPSKGLLLETLRLQLEDVPGMGMDYTFVKNGDTH